MIPPGYKRILEMVIGCTRQPVGPRPNERKENLYGMF